MKEVSSWTQDSGNLKKYWVAVQENLSSVANFLLDTIS